MRVLIVEDDYLMAETLQERLQHFGYETVVVSDKQAAMEAFRENPDFFAILFDGWIRGGHGDTCDIIADIVKTYDGHLVAMSSHTETRERQMAAGCSHECQSKYRAAKLVLDLAQQAEGAPCPN